MQHFCLLFCQNNLLYHPSYYRIVVFSFPSFQSEMRTMEKHHFRHFSFFFCFFCCISLLESKKRISVCRCERSKTSMTHTSNTRWLQVVKSSSGGDKKRDDGGVDRFIHARGMFSPSSLLHILYLTWKLSSGCQLLPPAAWRPHLTTCCLTDGARIWKKQREDDAHDMRFNKLSPGLRRWGLECVRTMVRVCACVGCCRL